METEKEKQQRTLLQNKAMHKYFSILAKSLNDAGWDMKSTLKPNVEIPWTEASIKEHLWRPIQKAMLDKTSTADLHTNEMNDVYECLNRHTASKLGVSVPFPDRHGSGA